MPTFELSTLRQMVLDRLDNNSVLYTNPELDAAINESVRIVNLAARFYQVVQHVPGFTQPNQRVYQTPPGVLVASHVYFEGKELQKLGLKRLARTFRNWATATTAAYGPVRYWSPIGVGQFIISPVDSVGGNDLLVSGTGEPPLLVNPADVLSLENEYVDLIVSYGPHLLPLKVGGKLFADGSISLNEFQDKLTERAGFSVSAMPRYRLLSGKIGTATLQ